MEVNVVRNKLYCGDNLDIMRDMSDASIDLIATDPPFNTGRNWGAFSDKWEGGLDGYLKFMRPRLEECHRLLKDTGSLYLHCDPTASHYLKVMLDGVFGIKQFRNEIVWCYTRPSNCNLRDFNRCHNIIFRYSRGKQWCFNMDNVRIAYSSASKDRERYADTKSMMPNNSIKRLNPKGKCPESWWMIPPIRGNAGEYTAYPTQKPIALYQRIIKASSNEEDVVLDPFCGSGTTLDAAQSLGRYYIGIDQNPDAIKICEKRLNPAQLSLFGGV